jgi:hypothetical protein
MTPELSLKLTFDWFRIFYKNKRNPKKVIKFSIDQFEKFLKLVKYFDT